MFARLAEPDITVPADEKKKPEGSVDRDVVLVRVETEKRMLLIKAWEDSKKSKAENNKKAYLEAEGKMVEKLEMWKSEYVEKMKNKLRSTQIRQGETSDRGTRAKETAPKKRLGIF